MTRIITAAALLMAVTTGAMAQQGVNSTNGFTPAQRASAEAAVKAAGFTPGAISYAQAGSAFMMAIKDGMRYYITLAPDGKLYPGQPFK